MAPGCMKQLGTPRDVRSHVLTGEYLSASLPPTRLSYLSLPYLSCLTPRAISFRSVEKVDIFQDNAIYISTLEILLITFLLIFRLRIIGVTKHRTALLRVE